MKNIAVFGMGYVGCVTSACLSRDGHHVIGVDIDEEKIAAINIGRAPISEPGLDDLIARAVDAGRLEATADATDAVSRSEIALIAVGTPSDQTGAVSSDAVEHVVASIGNALKNTQRQYLIVVRSTLWPGILEDRLIPLLERSADRHVGDGLFLCNHPEFLRESTAIRDYDDPPFILVGTDSDTAASQVAQLYPGVNAEVIITDSRTAALVKYACNAFHALKIGFANEIGRLAKSTGADGHKVMQVVCSDFKLNISPAYLRPGFAFGGSCLPKDLRALVRHGEQYAVSTELLRAIIPSNVTQIDLALREIRESGHRQIGIVGLSFKAGTDDLRESPIVILAETLLGRGYDLKIYDPAVMADRLIGQNLAYIERHLPHLTSLLTEDFGELFGHASLLVLGTDVADTIDWQTAFTGETLDLRRDLAVARLVQSVIS
jgi:GDP-mannose 6-dehydrogenase